MGNNRLFQPFDDQRDPLFDGDNFPDDDDWKEDPLRCPNAECHSQIENDFDPETGVEFGEEHILLDSQWMDEHFGARPMKW